MDPRNLEDIYDAVAAWQRATRELRAHLTEVYHSEGYDRHPEQMIAEALVLRVLNDHLDKAQDLTAGFVVALLREQPVG